MSKNLIKSQLNDDLIILNYLALLACILDPKLTCNKSLILFGIANKNELEFDSNTNTFKKFNTRLYKNYKKIEVIDILNNENLIFESIHDAESYTGIKKENIYVYISKNILGKRRYKFNYYDTNK